MMAPLLAISHTCVGLVDLSHECAGLYFPENGIESPGHGITSRTSCAMLEEALPGAISEGATILCRMEPECILHGMQGSG